MKMLEKNRNENAKKEAKIYKELEEAWNKIKKLKNPTEKIKNMQAFLENELSLPIQTGFYDSQNLPICDGDKIKKIYKKTGKKKIGEVKYYRGLCREAQFVVEYKHDGTEMYEMDALEVFVKSDNAEINVIKEA